MLKELKEHKRHEQPKAREWLGIETAPKDGTVVDIFRGDWKERCTNMQRVDLGNGNVFYDPVESGPCCVRDATHWMPIPVDPD